MKTISKVNCFRQKKQHFSDSLCENKYTVSAEIQKKQLLKLKTKKLDSILIAFSHAVKPIYINTRIFREGLQQFLMQKQRSGFSLIFLIFLISTRQVAWQGYGNMSSSNLTEIWTFINNNIGSYTATSSYDTFNTAFSDRLNTIWAPAWNIFTIKTTAAYDTVLYGYAFNNHWMWFNDYQVNGVVLTFVIWKDYNCLGWKTVGKNGAASGLAFMITNFKTSTMSYDKSNLWQATKAFNHKFDNQPGAYSFVSSQDTFSDFYGRICVKSDNYFYSRNDAPGYWPFVMGMGNTWGNIFIFQTR